MSGIIGLTPRSCLVDAGTNARTLNPVPGIICASQRSMTEIEQLAMQAAHQLRMATDGISLDNAVGQFIGGHSFSAGVMAGMTKNLVVSAIELAKLFKMFAMAEYYESRHAPSFWDRFKSNVYALSPCRYT